MYRRYIYVYTCIPGLIVFNVHVINKRCLQIFGEILNDKDTYDIDVSYGKKIKINNSNRDFTSRNFYRDKSIYLLNNETHTQKNNKKSCYSYCYFLKYFIFGSRNIN